MNTDTAGKLRTYSLNFDDLEVWTLEALLKLIEEHAKAKGLEVIKISCGLEVELEGFDDKADFEAFKAGLNARWIYFGYDAERDDSNE